MYVKLVEIWLCKVYSRIHAPQSDDMYVHPVCLFFHSLPFVAPEVENLP